MKQFAIYEENFERLEKKLNRIRTKCNKYGCGFHFEVVGDEFRTFTNEDGYEVTLKYIIVEAEGTAIVNGWEFVATLDHTEAGNILRTVKDIQIPERYHDCQPECEHCHSHRYRKNTYIVHNVDTDEFKQVGSSCLCDFTSGLSAEGVAGYIEMFDELIQGESASGSGGRIHTYFDTDVVLRYAREFIRHLGYISSSKAYEYGTTSTRECVRIKLDRRPTKYESEFLDKFETKFNPNWDRPEDIEFVEDVKEFIRNYDNTDNNSYVHNLKVITELDHIDYSMIGYAVSMIPFYMKEMDLIEKDKARKEARDAEVQKSTHIGNIKDKVDLRIVSGKCLSSYETQWGYSFLYKFVDEDGNVIMWSTGTAIEEGRVNRIKGTVKAHEEYNGVKQTWLTRCKVELAPEAVEDPDPEKDPMKALEDFMAYVNA